MLYPVAPIKFHRLVERLNAASDAENLPRPVIERPEGTDEELLEAVRRHAGDGAPADPVDGHFAFTFRGGVYVAVEVNWPKPLRSNEGERVLYTGNAPVGPDPMAMWKAMFLLTPVPQ